MQAIQILALGHIPHIPHTPHTPYNPQTHNSANYVNDSVALKIFLSANDHEILPGTSECETCRYRNGDWRTKISNFECKLPASLQVLCCL